MMDASPSMGGPGSLGTGFIQPVMVRIPEQWFCMGCETGRDDEKPAHRVWVDSFELAAYQVTNAEYQCVLGATNVWECAARGGAEGSAYPWGDSPPESLPDYAKRWKSGPEPVGLYAPNGFGLYNLGDNVHEWCADWYDANYYSCSIERNPRGPADGTRRVSRGGSWRHHIKVTRSAARSSIPPEFQYADYGFRIARFLTT